MAAMSSIGKHVRRSLAAAARAAGVTDARVLAAMDAVPRGLFVPAESKEEAYLDEPVPISHGQVTTQPSLVARMVEALELHGREKVLEIGTGYGYQTALLALLAHEVWSIELWTDLSDAAQAALGRRGIGNVNLIVGDGTRGLPEQAPFDAIIVAAAFPEVPGPLAEQLTPGGRLVQPIGPGGAEDVVLFRRREAGLVPERRLTRAHFVRLYGRHGYALESAPREP
jgi:protein-L-isoaspartate(D-aspartate) O-methyltransferase